MARQTGHDVSKGGNASGAGCLKGARLPRFQWDFVLIGLHQHFHLEQWVRTPRPMFTAVNPKLTIFVSESTCKLGYFVPPIGGELERDS